MKYASRGSCSHSFLGIPFPAVSLTVATLSPRAFRCTLEHGCPCTTRRCVYSLYRSKAHANVVIELPILEALIKLDRLVLGLFDAV
jgi:hypothetical protein